MVDGQVFCGSVFAKDDGEEPLALVAEVPADLRKVSGHLRGFPDYSILFSQSNIYQVNLRTGTRQLVRRLEVTAGADEHINVAVASGSNEQ